MEISEIRIGNYINFNNRIGGKVNDKDINGYFKITLSFFKSLAFNFDNSEDGELNNYYSPIPLTEEIFLKNGFEKNGVEFSNYNEGRDDCICGEFIDGLFYYTAGEGIRLSIGIKYLHQFQNLYFDLKGTELEINL